MYSYQINVSLPTGGTDMHGKPTYKHLFRTDWLDSADVVAVSVELCKRFPEAKLTSYKRSNVYEEVEL